MTLKSSIPQALKAIDKAADAQVFRIANRIRNEAIERILRGDKSGKLYKRGNRLHRASAPGQAPASDHGDLVGSIRVEHKPGSMTAMVIAGTNYAKRLEFGTPHLSPRPFMAPAAMAVVSQGLAQGFKIDFKKS
jgi:hypothetical protein